jgi:hypothetical protein
MPAFAGMTALLTACSGSPTIKHQVLTPPPSAPRAEFALEKPDVQSREVGEDAWKRNEQYGRTLTEALRTALQDRDKTIVPPPADTVRARVYIAYGAAPVKVKGRRAEAHVEVRLQLVDPETGAVRYSTHTQAPIAPSWFASWFGGPDRDTIIREVLEKAARDFVSRL